MTVEELAEHTRPLIEKKRSQRELLDLDARIAAAAAQMRGLQLSLVAMLEKRRTLREQKHDEQQ